MRFLTCTGVLPLAGGILIPFTAPGIPPAAAVAAAAAVSISAAAFKPLMQIMSFSSAWLSVPGPPCMLRRVQAAPIAWERRGREAGRQAPRSTQPISLVPRSSTGVESSSLPL